MSKLSELLNPTPASHPPPPLQLHVLLLHSPFTDNGNGNTHYSPSTTTTTTTITTTTTTSPLGALAFAASGRVAVTSDLSPTLHSTSSFASPNHHNRKDPTTSSRPGSSHYILPNPQDLADSARLSQHLFAPPLEHHDSLKMSDPEDNASRKLPPLRNVEKNRIDAVANALDIAVMLEENVNEHLPGIGGIQPLDNPQALPQLDGQSESIPLPNYTPRSRLVNGEAGGQSGWMETGQGGGADNQEATSHSAPVDPNASFDGSNTPTRASADFKREDSARASSVTPSVNNLGAPKPPQSKKRAAPKIEKKVEKKGTASAIKKTAANKKRKLDDESIGGTPISQRSGTPASSRASKTPAPRNQKRGSLTPMHSSPAPGAKGGDDDADMDDDSELFCICRKPDDHTWMIACDGGCEDWFHGRCVNMNEGDGSLIDKYICPNCKEKGIGQTTWKPMCRLDTCRKPARATGPTPSKYCSDEHGLQYMRKLALGDEGKKETSKNKGTSNTRKRRKENHTDHDGNEADLLPKAQTLEEDEDQSHLRGGVLRPSDLKTLTSGVRDLSQFRRLGDGILSPSRALSPTEKGDPDIKKEATGESRMTLEKSQVTYTPEETARLAEIAEKRAISKAARMRLTEKEKLLAMVRARAGRVLEEMNSNLSRKDQLKDICGFDSRLVWTDEEFDTWRTSPEGRKCLETGILTAPSSIPPTSSIYPQKPPSAEDPEGDISMTNGDHANSSVAKDVEEEEEWKRGVCPKKRCERHKAWFKLQQQEVNFEKDELRQRMRKLEKEEKGVVERAMVRHLEGGGTSDSVEEPTEVTAIVGDGVMEEDRGNETDVDEREGEPPPSARDVDMAQEGEEQEQDRDLEPEDLMDILPDSTD